MQSWKDHFAAPLFDHNHNASFELQTVPEAYRAGRHILPRIFFDRNHNRKPRIPQIQSDEQSTTLVWMDLFIFRCKLRRFHQGLSLAGPSLKAADASFIIADFHCYCQRARSRGTYYV